MERGHVEAVKKKKLRNEKGPGESWPGAVTFGVGVDCKAAGEKAGRVGSSHLCDQLI